jgi:hypothetical protein
MTEAEWLACGDPKRILEWLRGKTSDRKLRLFACGCCRLGWDRIKVARIKELVEIAERYADEPASEQDWLDAFHSTYPVFFTSNVVWPFTWEAVSRVSEGWLKISSERARRRGAQHLVDTLAQCALLFDLFGNPFQPWFVLTAWLRWNDGTIPKLAQGIYEERAFDRLPILADALEDAGCDDAELLAHCRGPGPHVRGCWVVDLLLGKS